MRSRVDEPDYYAVLGIPADASAAEITRAFRRQAFVAHPDHGGDAAAIRELYQARDTLLDPDRRAGYDRRRTTASTTGRPPGPGSSARTAPGPADGPDPPAADPFEWAAGAGPSTDDQGRFRRTTGVRPDPDPASGYDPAYSWLRDDRFGWWKPPAGPRSRRRRGGR